MAFRVTKYAEMLATQPEAFRRDVLELAHEFGGHIDLMAQTLKASRRQLYVYLDKLGLKEQVAAIRANSPRPRKRSRAAYMSAFDKMLFHGQDAEAEEALRYAMDAARTQDVREIAVLLETTPDKLRALGRRVGIWFPLIRVFGQEKRTFRLPPPNETV